MQDYNGLDKQFMSAEFKNVSLLTVENPIKRDKDRMIEDVVALRDADLNLPKELFCSTIHLKPCKSLREKKKVTHPTLRNLVPGVASFHFQTLRLISRVFSQIFRLIQRDNCTAFC